MARVLPIRAEQPPDDAIVIIRGGLMTGDQVRLAANRTFAIYALFSVSVEGVIDSTVANACRSSKRITNYHQIGLSTFGRVRSAGFAVLATFDHPHFTLVPTSPT